MKHILFFISVVCVAVLWQSCEEKVVLGSIYGVVTDRSTGEPIRNAEVTLSPGNKTTITGSSGIFEFVNLEPGQYSVSVEAVDYQYNNKMVTVVAGESVTCDFHLDKIEVEQELDISPSSLNFGSIQEQMSVSITNKGTEVTSWSLDFGNNKWLSATPISGSIDVKKTQTIVFKVDRSLLSKDETAVVSLSAFGNSYPLTVSCLVNQNKGILNVTPTVLDFGVETTEMSFTIKNIGDADLTWNVKDLSNSCITLSEIAGELSSGASKVVKLLLNRALLTDNLSTSFIVSDGFTEQEIKVLATIKKSKGILNVTPTVLDFGVESTEMSFTVKNIGDASLSWYIRDLYSLDLTLSEESGDLESGASKIVKVLLDREWMTKDLSTSFIVSDGSAEQEIKVLAKYSNNSDDNGGNGNNGGNDDNGGNQGNNDGVSIVNPFPAELSISNIKCVGYKGSGIVHFQFTAINIDNSTSDVRFYIADSKLVDEYGNIYSTFAGRYIDLPVGVPVIVKYDSGNLQVKGVDISANKFAQISVYVDTPKSPANYLVFKNVPIEWVDDSSTDNGVNVNNPFPTELSISNIKCVGYKDSGIVHFQFTATNIAKSSTSDIRFRFGESKLYDEYGNTYGTFGDRYIDLPVDIPVIVKYDSGNLQIKGVDTSAKKFAQISVYVDPPKSPANYLVLKNVQIEWQ